MRVLLCTLTFHPRNQLAQAILDAFADAETAIVHPSEWVAAATRQQPDLVIVDFLTYRRAGASSVNALRARFPALRVLLIVNRIDTTGIADFLAAPETEFIDEPFHHDLVAHRLRKLFPTGAPTPSASVLRSLRDPDSGRLDARAIATYLKMPLSSLARSLGRNVSTVHKTPSAESLQEPLQTIHDLIATAHVRSSGHARTWLNTAHPMLDGKTPLRFLRDGRLDRLQKLVDS